MQTIGYIFVYFYLENYHCLTSFQILKFGIVSYVNKNFYIHILKKIYIFTDPQHMWLAVEKTVLFEISCPLQSLFLLSTAYFVLNMQYPSSAGASLEFIQR